MKQKVRKMGIRFKLLLPISVLLLVICASLGVSAYMQSRAEMIKMGGEEAKLAAAIESKNLDTIALSKIGADGTGAVAYKVIYSALQKIVESTDVEYMYTLYAENGQVFYSADADEKDAAECYGTPFAVPYDEIKSVFDGEVYVSPKIDEDGLITAYAPLTEANGNVLGAVACDYNASKIVEALDVLLLYVIGFAVLFFIIGLVVINFIIGRIIKNLKNVNGKIYDLVHSEGDLTQKLEIKSGDELELIAENVNVLLEYIRGIMLNISDGSTKLNLSAKNVVESLGTAGDRITDVSATMEEMSASMEEISATLGQVDNNVGQVYTLVSDISKKAQDSSESAKQTMLHATELRDLAAQEQESAKAKTAQITANMNEQIEKSKAVSEIDSLTGNIISISSQTNLLSLNASIEAARAGEAGRGFAVVADEIGKLATDSANAAARIQQVSQMVISAVNNLASSSAEMVAFVDEVAMKGYDRLLQTSEEYRDDVDGLSNLMQQFASDSEQIKTNIESVTESISGVNTAVEESTRGVVTVAEVSVELTNNFSGIGSEADSNMHIATDLDGEVNKFKL